MASSSSAVAPSDWKMIRLRNSDGEEFEVEEAVANQCQTIRHMIEDDCADDAIPLPNVTAKILSKVIEYCKKHVESNSNSNSVDDDELKSWDAEFMKVDQSVLYDLILSANYLDIKELQELTCHIVANMIKGKTPEEIPRILNVKNDFMPEEEKEIRKENQWAFE